MAPDSAPALVLMLWPGLIPVVEDLRPDRSSRWAARAMVEGSGATYR
jgi:hypothetical protein